MIQYYHILVTELFKKKHKRLVSDEVELRFYRSTDSRIAENAVKASIIYDKIRYHL